MALPFKRDPTPVTQRLALIAEDPEDLEILAARVQDAILRVADIAYVAKRRQVALVMARFMWEEVDPDRRQPLKGRRFHRTQAGLHFNGVANLQAQNIDREDPEALLSLLSIDWQPAENGAGTILLVFSGGATLRMDVECIDATLNDIDTPWVTENLPDHQIDKDV